MKRKLTTEGFIERARQLHDGKYDYSKVDYVNTDTKVCIICPIHGEFWQTPHNHLQGQNCPKCTHKSTIYTTDEWIKEARKVHGNKYDYSKVDYKGNKIKVCLVCPIHGEFWIRPNNHLIGQACPKCGIEKIKTTNSFTRKWFIQKAQEIHGNKYNYSKVEYINNHTKVCIIFPTHGEFWQIPSNHLNKHGCPYCNSSFLENIIYEHLKEEKIDAIQQKRFEWLGLKSLDFYLPTYNVGIECQGIQHFIPSSNEKSFFNLEKVNEIKNNDLIKRELCNQNGIKIFYYSNLGIEYPYKVYENFNEMIGDIKKYGK